MDQPLRTLQRRSNPTLVVGLGNHLLGDDGVGWCVAEQIREALRSTRAAVDVDCLSVGGLRLMERLTGYERVILIDATTTGRSPVGSLSQFTLSDPLDPIDSAHGATLQSALRLGRALGVELPKTIVIIGIEAEITFDFTEVLTPAIAEAVPRAAQLVLDLVQQTSPAAQQR